VKPSGGDYPYLYTAARTILKAIYFQKLYYNHKDEWFDKYCVAAKAHDVKGGISKTPVQPNHGEAGYIHRTG
jgi:hypothetical protein